MPKPPLQSDHTGFLKLALVYGIPVVPYFAFGESDLYVTFNHGKEFQLWLASTYKIAFPPSWSVRPSLSPCVSMCIRMGGWMDEPIAHTLHGGWMDRPTPHTVLR